MSNEILDKIKGDGITKEEATEMINLLRRAKKSFEEVESAYLEDKERYERMIERRDIIPDDEFLLHIKVCSDCKSFLENYPKMQEAYKEDRKRLTIYLSVLDKLKLMIKD